MPKSEELNWIVGYRKNPDDNLLSNWMVAVCIPDELLERAQNSDPGVNADARAEIFRIVQETFDQERENPQGLWIHIEKYDPDEALDFDRVVFTSNGLVG